MNKWAIKRLRECGFDEIRAKNSLQSNDGDVGASLEALLYEAFQLSSSSSSSSSPSDVDRDEIASLREDEMMAVTSIYGDLFEEKIANKLWVMKLQLEHIVKLVEGGGGGAEEKKKSVDTRPICTFFAKGNKKSEKVLSRFQLSPVTHFAPKAYVCV